MTSICESLTKVLKASISQNAAHWTEVSDADMKISSLILGSISVIVGILLMWGSIEGYKSLSGCCAGTQVFVGVISTLALGFGIGCIYSGFRKGDTLMEQKNRSLDDRRKVLIDTLGLEGSRAAWKLDNFSLNINDRQYPSNMPLR